MSTFLVHFPILDVKTPILATFGNNEFWALLALRFKAFPDFEGHWQHWQHEPCEPYAGAGFELRPKEPRAGNTGNKIFPFLTFF